MFNLFDNPTLHNSNKYCLGSSQSYIGSKFLAFGNSILQSLDILIVFNNPLLSVSSSKLFIYMTKWFKDKLIKYCQNIYLKIFIGGSLMVIATLVI